MIAHVPNKIPQYQGAYGADQPRTIRFQHQKPPYSVLGPVYAQKMRSKEVLPLNPMALMVQRNPIEKSLPAHKTPFELRADLSKLGGILGHYDTTVQSGKPLFAQRGVGAYNLKTKEPLQNTNF